MTYLTEAQQARAEALTAAAELVPYPDNSTSPYETMLALAEWILGDEPELSDPDATPDLPDWATDQSITQVRDVDGDVWRRTGDDEWVFNYDSCTRSTSEELIDRNGPITPIKES